MKVLGYLYGKSKSTGNNYTVVHVAKEFEEYQKNNAFGLATESIYVPEIIKLSLGDEIELEYDRGFGGKAIVKNILVKN